MTTEFQRLHQEARQAVIDYTMAYCPDVTVRDVKAVLAALGTISVDEAKHGLAMIQRDAEIQRVATGQQI